MSCGTTNCPTIRRYAKTTNGGTTWNTAEIDLGPQSSQLEIANIHGVSELVAYAAAFPKSANILGGIWKTANGGTTWTRQDTAAFADPASFANLVYFWNANEGVCMGDPTNGYFEVYTTVNAGETWTRVPSSTALIPIDLVEYGVPYNFTVLDNTIWTSTTLGRILKSTDKGYTWTASQSPFPDFPCCFGDCSIRPKLAFTNQNDGLLQSPDYLLYQTHDGGATWEYLNWSGTVRNFGIAAVPGLANTYVSLGEDINFSERGSSYTIDGGQTWVSINNNPDTTHVNGGVLAFLNEDVGFASGFSTSPTQGGIFRWGGGALLRQALSVSTVFASDNALKAFPNPTSGYLTLAGKFIHQVELYDLLGNKIKSISTNQMDSVVLDLNAVANGVYMLKTTSEKGISTIKILKYNNLKK
jgi:photosystem II stability/assembly factor-like uncharacterized protein